MLLNAALEAHRARLLSAVGLASCMCTAAIWLMALGVVTISVASVAGTVLSMPVDLPR
jgi:hypothetical protein